MTPLSWIMDVPLIQPDHKILIFILSISKKNLNLRPGLILNPGKGRYGREYAEDL
jgi:hypothetical protein